MYADLSRLVPLEDHVDAWIDRVGNMIFIADEIDGATMSAVFFRAACNDHHKNHGRTEAAVWWM